MKLDVEYAIKKDIRNNPVVREIDAQHKRDLFRTVCMAGLIVLMLLFAAWQRFEIVDNGYNLERLQKDRQTEMAAERKLKLEVETLRAPQTIETQAVQNLHMVQPSMKDTIVIERATGATATKAIVAEVR